ncbi:CGP-CTERM sorting domain-containing protein [Thermococcus sp. LS2]|uniref:CGP-CTERM sorting domain-containing protein n=1 Tax=Thermococcus sp. LS2 TaxID=1638260 RepID=UPI001438C283|nr:CGP-CTERM sorting domain-containing protein [Thermococcus sp. LS2]NJE11816.1 CGP-CTERM sorting domain-containing protein [Thermococcus sp. LS2]
MRKGLVLVLMFITALSFANQAFAYEPQRLFDIEMYITVYPSGTAMVKINAKLIDPAFIAYLTNLNISNPQSANNEFQKMVYSLIYRNFKREVEEKSKEAMIVIPETGFIKISKNWTAVVNFKIYNFLVEKNQTLQSSVYGPMRFLFKNHVFAYTWKKLTLVFPKEMYVVNLAPAPKEFTENVAIWENGNYLPIIVLTFNETVFERERSNTTTIIPFEEFLNKTTKIITIKYDTFGGVVYFNGTMTGMKPQQYHIAKLIDEFNRTMDLIKFDIKSTENGVTFSGEAKPMLQYKETLTKKTWNVTVKLPFKFDKVHIVPPNNQDVVMVSNKITENKVTMVFEEKKICGPGIVVGLALLPLLLRKRRR